MATGSSSNNAIPSSAVPIAGGGGAPPAAPTGASATSRASPAGEPSTITPSRLNRGNSFRIPLPPNSPSTGAGAALSPSSPGPGVPSQLGTSYGSTTSNTGSRLGNFALGFRRNRGASTNRGEITSPVGVAGPPSPPATTSFPSLQASTSLTDFGVPYFDGNSTGEAHSNNPAGATVASPSGHTPSASVSSTTASTGRGYFTRRGFGRKNTGPGGGGGLLSGGGRTPTSEQAPSLSSAIQRSRSSSQPSLPMSVSNNANAQQVASMNAPNSANAATMVFSGTSQPVVLSGSTQGGALNNGGSSSTDSSRRASGEATRAPPASATAAPASTTSAAMHQRTASQAQTSLSAPATATTSAPPASSSTTTSSSETQHIRLVPHLESTRSLHFDPVSRDILPTIPLRIGRFTDRNPNQPISMIDQNRVAFKSKVVSRTHAEIWFEANSANTSSNGNGWFIRDLKSSSGTFLNHIRLSGAGMESRPFPIRDGDVLQLGVDYQGGTEEIYRCVKMRIELNRGWQRGANSFNTNALRQIRALGNVTDQPASTEETKKKKKKHKKKKSKKHDKKADAAAGDHAEGGDDGTASDGMQVDKKEKKEKSAAPASGVTDCCICLFSVTVYQALFIAPCSHIFHFKCIRPLLMQHHPGFSCPLCRTFGDLEADVEQDDVPEPVAEESSSSSSGESGSESEEELMAVEQGEFAPALPDKDQAGAAAASINPPSGPAGENTAVYHSNAISLVSSDPNMDTLRPGRKSPLVPSLSEFGASSSSANAQEAGNTASARPSLDVARPPSGTRTPPSRGSRVASFQSAPPSGAAVAAALAGHTTPNSHHHHHSHHHSGGENSFNPPSAGDFDPDIRRGSIYVHGADGHAMHIPITGRSRPGSVHEADLSSDNHHHSAHHHHHHHNNNGNNATSTQSPSVSAAEKSKARSVRSMRMTKSKNSTTSLRNAAALSSPSNGPATSSVLSGHRRRESGPSSDDDEEDVNMEEPLTARPMPGAAPVDGQYPFPGAVVSDESEARAAGEDTQMRNGDEDELEQDTTPPTSHKEDSEGQSSDVAASKGKGKERRSGSSSTHKDALPMRQAGSDGSKQTREDTNTASVHAVV